MTGKQLEKGMDRRRFVRDASYAVAGAIVASSALGCAANVIFPDVPLIPLAPPVDGVTYIRASQIGCALDCNLTTGLNKHTGGTATDDGPRINAAMAAATASNPITLIIDGSALISGLFMPAGGYWGIEGLGSATGFFVKAGTNNDGIHNGGPNAANPSDPGPVRMTARGSSVTLSNFMLNGNQGNGHSGDSTSGAYQGQLGVTWYFGINLMNLDNISIVNLTLVHTPTYHIRLVNTGNVAVTGCSMNSSGQNTDGVHVDGPGNDITITNCNFITGDDAIALNCPEGYSGNIERVSISNCTFKSLSLARLYTATSAGDSLTIDTVSVTNCSGVFTQAAFLIGDGPSTVAASVDGLSVSNCTLSAPAMFDVSVSFGSIAVSGVTFSPIDSFLDVGYSILRTSSRVSQRPYKGSSLSLANVVISRLFNTAIAAVILTNGSSIGEIEINGLSLQDSWGSSFSPSPELLNMANGMIGQIAVDALTSAQIAAPVSPGGFSSIGLVSGAGVLGTGWKFPDSAMANGTPYLSANSSQESIKVAGVVVSYP
jgi:hypothetical protein